MKAPKVYETFDAFLNFDECTIRHEIDNLALDCRANREAFLDLFPRIVGKLLEAKGDAFAFAIDLDDHHFDLLTLFHHLGWVVNTTP
jgi:hypothetical protein